MMNIDDIVASFQKAYPDDTILFYKFKSGGASSYYGERLLKVKLDDGYFLQIIKLLKSSGELMNSDDIKTKAFPFVYESKNEINDIQRRDTLREKLKNMFPKHYVNVFIFNDSDWSRYGNNTKGGTYFTKEYGSEIDVVLG